MHPVLFRINVWTLVIVLVGIGLGLLYLAALLRKRGPANGDRSRTLTSLGYLALLAALIFLFAYKVLRMGSWIRLSSYWTMMVAALVTGIFLGMRRAGREGLPERPVALLGILLVPVALLGSKLFFWIFETPPRTLELALSLKGGLVIYGGIVLSVIFTFFYARQRGLPLGKLFDAFTPSLALGIGIGRLGCFFSGCCYGSATTCWSGTVFPPRAHVYRALGRIGADPDGHAAALTAVPEALRPLVLHSPDSAVMRVIDLLPIAPLRDFFLSRQHTIVPVHPTQLYSALNGFLAFILLVFLYKKKKFDGEVFLWFVMYYAVTRFLIEMFRIDTPHGLVLGAFSLSQAIGLLLFPAALTAWLLLRRRAGKTDPA